MKKAASRTQDSATKLDEPNQEEGRKYANAPWEVSKILELDKSKLLNEELKKASDDKSREEIRSALEECKR